MEDILASIRRILAEDEQPLAQAESRPEAPPSSETAPAALLASMGDNVLILDNSMMVKAPTSAAPEPVPPTPEAVAPTPEAVAPTPEAVAPTPEAIPPMPAVMAPAPEPVPLAAADLVAPEAAETAVHAVSSLVRTLAAERSVLVSAGGPTVEGIVGDTVRPLIKAWLDANLPELVERLVRAEIERVVGRAV